MGSDSIDFILHSNGIRSFSDFIYETDLVRSQETTDEIIGVLEQTVTRIQSKELKERDYGNFTGLNKNQVENQYGYELFEKWHRGWDFPLPQGETLKDVTARAVPYFEKEISPKLLENKNIIISSHGNTLRALVKFIEKISDDQFHLELLEIPVGTIVMYKFEKGKFTPFDLRVQ
mgnify:CR=1 FL=1